MEPHWASYFCNVNGKLASIFLDLGLRNATPDLARPWLLWVWVCFKQPRTDGLSSSEEFPVLCRIEDQLNIAMERHCGTSLAGGITTDGRREFYYYGSHANGFETAVAEVAAAFPEYDLDHGTQHDPQWTQYLNVLFPSDDDLQKIANREVLDVMQREGDQPEVPREVLHWSYFVSEADRASFKRAISEAGYRVDSEGYYAKSENPFGICFAKVQDLAASSIDTTVLELVRVTEQFNGEYDGWEAQVVSGEGSEQTIAKPN